MGEVFGARSFLKYNQFDMRDDVVAITPGIQFQTSKKASFARFISNKYTNWLTKRIEGQHGDFDVPVGDAAFIDGYEDISPYVIGLNPGSSSDTYEMLQEKYAQAYAKAIKMTWSTGRRKLHLSFLAPNREKLTYKNFRQGIRLIKSITDHYNGLVIMVYSGRNNFFINEHADLVDDLNRYTAFNCDDNNVKYSIRVDDSEEVERARKIDTDKAEPISTPDLIDEIEQAVAKSQPPFKDVLLSYMKEKQMTAPDVYKPGNIDRRVFAKIYNVNDYIPHKETIVAFAFAMKLTKEEIQDLLGAAGLTLGRSTLFDVIVSYFLEKGIYDIDIVNEALLYYNQNIVGRM